MSANDFQTKYSSVMESMLKGAIAETTKLFETMVDELKAEISGMKKENEDLKIRCSQFESARNPPTVHTGGSDSLQGPTDGSEKRDRAVQCDLVPIRTILVEQCQPLRHSSLQQQEQQCSYEPMEYSLQDHTYGEGTTQMAFVFVKQEDSHDDSSQQTVVKQEEAEALVSGPVISGTTGSSQASACATENEGLPYLGMDGGLQGAQNQLSELEHSRVLSRAAIKDNIEEESELSPKEELITPEKQPLVVAQHQSEVEPLEKEQPFVKPQQCQRDGNVSINEQANVSQQHDVDLKSTEQRLSQPTPLKEGETCDSFKSGVAQSAVASPQPGQRRRGRPPKKNKRLQHPGKEIGSLTASEASECSSEKEKSSESQQPSMDIEEGAIKAPFTASPANETPNTQTVQPRERRTSVTLQDALLLVEAMNQSTVKGILTSPQRMAAQTQTQCSPSVGTLETVDEIPAQPTQLTKEKLGVASVTSDATPTNKAQAQIKVVIPKRQHTVTPSLTPPVKASVQSLQQHHSHPLITVVAPSKPSTVVSHKLVAMPRSESSLIRHKIAALLPTQLPTVVSTVVAAQKNRFPGITTAGMPLGTTSLSSVPQKTKHIMCRKSFSIGSLKPATPTSSDLQSGTLPHPKITIVIPRQVSAVASSKPQSQTIVPTTTQESTESAAAIVSSPQLITSSQDLSISVDTQTVLDEVAAISSQKRYKTLNNLEFPKQTASVSEAVNASIETCSSSNMSVRLVQSSMSTVVPPTAVVRLTRLPFPISAKEAVLVSRLPKQASPESQSILKEDTTQEKPSYVVILTPLSEALILKEDSDSRPSTPFKVSAPVVQNSTIAINKTEPPAVNGTVGEPTSNSDEEIISMAVQDCASPDDPPLKEKESASLIKLTPITNKDTNDHHLQITKTQFLAQLAVTPVPQEPQTVSSDNSVSATTAETSTSEKKRLQKKSLVAQLRSHLKTRLQARRMKTNSETCTAEETPTVNSKKSKFENESPTNIDATREPIPISPKDPGVVEDVTFPVKTTKSPTPVSPRRSGLREADAGPEKTVNEQSFISSRRFKATTKSAPVTPRRSSPGAHGVGAKTKKSTSVSPKESTEKAKRGRPKKTKSTSVSPRRSNSIKESASPKKTKSTSVSPRRSISIKGSTTPKKTKSTSVSPRKSSSKNTRNISVHSRWTSSTRDGASPESTKATSMSPQRTSRDGVVPKKAKSFVSQETSSKNGTSPQVSIDNSTFCRRKCTLPKDGSSSKPKKRESSSFSPRYSISTDCARTNNSKSEMGSPKWPKLAKDGVSPTKTRESTPAKKPRLSQDGTSPKQKLIVGDAKRLAKAAKAKTMAKKKNGAKTGQLAESRASCDVVRKCTAKAVWTPPRMQVSKTPPKRKQPLSPRQQDHTVIYPHSVSLLPIPVKAPPVVSPLQPLSVIGRRLLKNQCGECGRVLSSLAALESHVSLHTGRRPFSCTLCGKRFPDSKGLKRHGRVHRNGRIHICQQCGKGFVYRFGLTKHLQMVHRKLKPHICHVCKGGFFTKRDMEAHVRMHTGEKPFHCNLCVKKFARRVELNVHLRWHNGEKRHWCPFCGKGFLDFNNLKRHKYIHTGEKPHSCPHCPKSFTQSGHLKKHIKTVHKIL